MTAGMVFRQDAKAVAATLGDVNCDGVANSVDATVVLQFDAHLITSLRCQGAADVNDDGTINAIDAVVILQLGAGLLGPQPPSNADIHFELTYRGHDSLLGSEKFDVYVENRNQYWDARNVVVWVDLLSSSGNTIYTDQIRINSVVPADEAVRVISYINPPLFDLVYVGDCLADCECAGNEICWADYQGTVEWTWRPARN